MKRHNLKTSPPKKSLSKKSSARTSPSTRAKRAACPQIIGFLWLPPKKTSPKPTLSLVLCWGEDSSLHLLRDQVLSLMRLPISPPQHFEKNAFSWPSHESADSPIPPSARRSHRILNMYPCPPTRNRT